MKIAPKNWQSFQHYKDRNPSWIKLHKKLLDDFEFQSLPLASRALAPMLWLLASEHTDGVIDADPAKLSFRLRCELTEIEGALSPLIGKGFFTVVQFDSKPLAAGEPAAMPEKRREERETEKEKQSPEQALSSVSSIPREPAPGAPVPWPAIDDPRVMQLHALVQSAMVRRATALLAQQWVSEGITEVQIRAAIDRCRKRGKPVGTAIEVTFFQLMLQDILHAGVGYDATAVRDATIAAINAKEASGATH